MKTTHVLYSGRALCGFMVDCVPGGWPDGHNWVSFGDVWFERGTIVYATPAANRPKENNKPCDQCLGFVADLKKVGG